MLMETCALALGARAATARNAAVQRSVFHPRGRSLIPGLLTLGIFFRSEVKQDGRAIFILGPRCGLDTATGAFYRQEGTRRKESERAI
jgi:hypothetical protein